MVFYRGAIQQALQAFYALKAEAYQLATARTVDLSAPPGECLLAGNTTFLTGFESGEAGRARLAIRRDPQGRRGGNLTDQTAGNS